MRDGLSVVLVEQEPELPLASSLRECLAVRGKLDAIHDERDRWRIEARLVEYLHRFGLDEASRPESASGGEKKRAALALAFAQAPDLLLLDEPTNHLDLDGITLVEELVAKAPAAIVITHDRAFLDRVATRIVELGPRSPALLSRKLQRLRVEEVRPARRRSGGAAKVRPLLGTGGNVDPQRASRHAGPATKAVCAGWRRCDASAASGAHGSATSSSRSMPVSARAVSWPSCRT
jgi:ABC-type nitrate/sulfonate/bicarbonate transport system ATPase subunit